MLQKLRTAFVQLEKEYKSVTEKEKAKVSLASSPQLTKRKARVTKAKEKGKRRRANDPFLTKDLKHLPAKDLAYLQTTGSVGGPH